MGETIKIENLRDWLVEYVTKSVRETKSDVKEFKEWAKNFDKRTAAILINAEFHNDFGYSDCKEISIEDAKRYAQSFIDRIVIDWYVL